MPSPSATKASEKQQACRKLLSLLHKEYGKATPRFSMPVLETMLFAVCLEDNSWDAAEQAFANLNRQYYDLNEIRVSSVSEIEESLGGIRGSDWAGLRIRSILRFVFESTYSYDYEKLKRLTQDSAQKRLKKIDNMSAFIRNFTVQQCLAGYLVCLDLLSTRAAIHLGIVPPGFTEEQAGDFLKPGLKKADAFSFACALRCLATDPRFIDRLSEPPDEDVEFDVKLVETRFSDLRKPKKKKRKTAAKKAASTGKPGKKKAAAAKAPARKKASKGSTGKASTASRASGTAKSTSRKSAVASTTAKKPVARKARKKKAVSDRKSGGRAASAAGRKKPAVKKTVRKPAAGKASAGKKAAKKKAARRKK